MCQIVMDMAHINEFMPHVAPPKRVMCHLRGHVHAQLFLQYTGYAAAIAAYNNRDVNSTVNARETIKIPPLYVVAPPTAWNGSVPNVETVLGSLYPSLPLPAITLKPKERDWLEIYLEATIATAIMICAPELIAQALGLVLTTVTGAMVTGAIAGAMASTVDQLIAMGYHSQASFKLKDVAINAMMTGITGGLNKLAQGGEAFAAASLGVKAGALAHGVVTAEAIALAQQAALVATHLQKHMDWHAVSSAVFNAVMDDTAKNLIGGEGDFAKLARSGMTRFADALGAAAIYKQKMTFSGMTAQVLGGMTGSVMGSQMMDAEVRKHEAAMRVERGMEVGFAGGGRSVAQLGMSVDEDRDRPTPKPSYAKVDMDRDIAEAKTEHEASSLAEVLRASRMDRWREDVGAIGSQVGQFFNENGPSISQGLRYFSLLNDLLSLSSQSSSKYSSARTHVTSFSLPNTKFDYWKSVNDGFWGTIGTINVFGDMIGYPLHHPIDTVTGIKNLFGLGVDTTKVLMGTDPGGASRQNLINAKDAFVLGMNKLSEDTLSNDTYRSHYALGSGLFSIALMFGGELGLAGRLSRVTIEWGESFEGLGAGKSVGAARRLDYEPAPYHKAVDSGNKSRGPINGQDALDVSIQVKPTSPRRIGIDHETGDIVVFDKTRENVYHGHVRTWNELHSDMQRALQDAGMVNRRGKILR